MLFEAWECLIRSLFLRGVLVGSRLRVRCPLMEQEIQHRRGARITFMVRSQWRDDKLGHSLPPQSRVSFPVRFAYSLVVQSVRLRREGTICFRLGPSCGKALQTKVPLNLCHTATIDILPGNSLSRLMIADLTMFTLQNLASAAGQKMPHFIKPQYLSLCLFKLFFIKSYHLELVPIQVLPALKPVSVR